MSEPEKMKRNTLSTVVSHINLIAQVKREVVPISLGTTITPVTFK